MYVCHEYHNNLQHIVILNIQTIYTLHAAISQTNTFAISQTVTNSLTATKSNEKTLFETLCDILASPHPMSAITSSGDLKMKNDNVSTNACRYILIISGQ